MMKKFRIISLCFLFMLIIPIRVEAKDETLGDLKKTWQNLQAEYNAYQNKTEQAKNEIKQKQAAIAKAQEEMIVAEHEQEETELQIEESNERIAELKQEAEHVLQYLQQVQSQNVYVEYVTGASSMTDLITRIEAVKQVSGYIQDTLDNLEAEIRKNEALVQELKEKQQALADKIDSYEKAIAQLQLNAEEYNEFALDIGEKVQVAKENYEANRKICMANLGKADDSLKLTDCSKVPANGAWLKPLTSGVVTSPQGYRTHPVTGKIYTFHDGIDIGVSEGTPVYAAAAGTVVARVSRSSCGGNKLFINVIVNGKEYTTWYYHLLSFNVNVGDVVTQNTVIGYVGGYSTSSRHGGYDTCTTGAHLHFGVQNGFYGTGVQTSRVIPAPGFRNEVGYRFTSRSDFYR